MAEFEVGLIDVFADTLLSGSPLALVEDADGLSEDQMRRIAGEFNQAETTFILKSSRADRRLRSFTASGVEVFGAGHNALGAWLWLAAQGKLGPLRVPQTFQQEIGSDVLPIVVATVGERIVGRMRQTRLRLSSPLTDVAPLAEALGLSMADIDVSPPPRPADTGACHLLVRVRDIDTVDRATPVANALLGVLRVAGAEGCYVYSHSASAPDDAYARFFNPTVGLWEDAATGTAAGPLAAYLAHEGVTTNGKLAVEQGTRMGRGSTLHISLTPEPEISGSGVIVLRGKISV